jgi:hypothetical protein
VTSASASAQSRFDANGFAADAEHYTLIGEEPVTAEERENVEEASS